VTFFLGRGWRKNDPRFPAFIRVPKNTLPYLAKLLQRPFRYGVICNIEMNDLPS